MSTTYKRINQVLDTPGCNGSFTASAAGTSSCTDGVTQNGNVISGALRARTGGDVSDGGDPTDPSIGVRASISAGGDPLASSIGGSLQNYNVGHNVFDILHFGTGVTSVTLGFDVSGSLSAISSADGFGGGGTGAASIQILVGEWREGGPGTRLGDNSTNPFTTLYEASAGPVFPGGPAVLEVSAGRLGVTEVTFEGLTDGRLNLYTSMFAIVTCSGRFQSGTTCSATSDFYGSAEISSYVARNASGAVISTDVTSASGFNFEGLEGSGGGPAVVPLPASAWLLLAGLAGLWANGR